MDHAYPVRVEGRLDQPLSRWLWLVKWLLALPHWIVLAFLWLGFVLATIVAFFVVLFTGRYPRGLHRYNVGVLRWSWRVGYYAVSAIATDRYPPFTLADVPDYPARLEVDYPERNRRGVPLIGRWLLGIPQYALGGIFAGGGGWVWSNGHWTRSGPSVIGVLLFVAAVLLLVGRGYPRAVYDLVMGFNRWSIRALAYGTFLTSEYPPFRLDQGAEEPTPPPPAPAPGPAA